MAEAPQETGNKPEARVAAGPVVLADRFFIDAGAPLSDFDTPSAKAYAVEDRREPGRRLFALICMPGLPARTQVMVQLKGVSVRGLMLMVEWGTLFWPPSNQVCMGVVYEQPEGGRVVPVDAKKISHINEYDFAHRVIEPVLTALQDLGVRSVSHRNIRPTNLFWLDEKKQEVVLGDCVTSPPGFDQPVIYEPIERGMASPAGRGTGSIRDDLYALGVTSVYLLLGFSPVENMEEDDLLAGKVEQGTYATICGNARVPLSMLEPLRGLLTDDGDARWSLEALDLWTNGRQMTPIQKRAVNRADKPFPFAERQHITTGTLAQAFSRNVREAARTLKDEHFHTWLKRNMNLPTAADMIASFAKESDSHKHGPGGSDDYLVAKSCILLDPSGPVRYKGQNFLPDGFGPMIAVELLRQGNNKISSEILNYELPQFWISQQVDYSPEYTLIERDLSQIKTFLKTNDMGYGIERCLYELNSEITCQSPLVINSYVAEIGDLLPALDEAAKSATAKTVPMDHHIAAFIAGRFSEDIAPHLKALSDEKEETVLIGILSLLAFLQWRLRTEPLYGLSSWLGGMLQPAINTYHSRTTRREMEREIPKLVRQGSLPDLFDLIDNPENRRQDVNAFKVACQQFREAEAEIEKIETGDTANAGSMLKVGQQTSAMTSIVLTMIAIVIIFLLKFW